jgi:hypothetical protein
MIVFRFCEMLWNVDVDHGESSVDRPLQVLLYRISLCTWSVSVEPKQEKERDAPGMYCGVHILEFSGLDLH